MASPVDDDDHDDEEGEEDIEDGDDEEDHGDHADDREEDMLDQAFGLEPTSRLGCQLRVDARFDGQTVELPEATRNFYVDGHVPQPH